MNLFSFYISFHYISLEIFLHACLLSSNVEPCELIQVWYIAIVSPRNNCKKIEQLNFFLFP